MAMARRLPSLNGLRAFEAAGRHGSFTAAARELNVTQTAVSRMVRLLEGGLGVSLFRRHANAVELTAQGCAFLSGLTDSFNSIAALTEKVSAMRAGPVLTIGVPRLCALPALDYHLGYRSADLRAGRPPGADHPGTPRWRPFRR
jgi:DNA-binding transcriptional LysR family regulator